MHSSRPTPALLPCVCLCAFTFVIYIYSHSLQYLTLLGLWFSQTELCMLVFVAIGIWGVDMPLQFCSCFFPPFIYLIYVCTICCICFINERMYLFALLLSLHVLRWPSVVDGTLKSKNCLTLSHAHSDGGWGGGSSALVVWFMSFKSSVGK